jgi:hypothetical protein
VFSALNWLLRRLRWSLACTGTLPLAQCTKSKPASFGNPSVGSWSSAFRKANLAPRPSTIIGAKAFHNPVRDGKVWDHLAMVVKRNWLPSRLLRDAPANWKKHTASDQYGSASSGYEGVERGLRCTSILRSVVNNLTHYNLKGYRIKPHGQLVLVSSTITRLSDSLLTRQNQLKGPTAPYTQRLPA